MKRLLRSLRKGLHEAVRLLLGALPRRWRFALFRRMVDCDPSPGTELQLKIADTREELESCFALLHDAYVAAGFMKPDPSGLRVTIYHALPTTTTLCAKVDDRVVGTISLIREGVFGFPLQQAFDLGAVRAQEGQIAEVSALAVHPDFRKTGGRILFPLMKFMYEYCTSYFDTRHLVIAVNPNKIELYESLLMFERLQAHVVENYDFANGAPAVGASLDLAGVRKRMKRLYGGRPLRRNLYHYFMKLRLPNIQAPARRYHTTNDPVMTGELIDYFFNRRTQAFAALDDRKKLLLRSIYDLDAYTPVLPTVTEVAKVSAALRRHQRYSIRCPARFSVRVPDGIARVRLKVIEMSLTGCLVQCAYEIPAGVQGDLVVELGAGDHAVVPAAVVRRTTSDGEGYYGMRVLVPDAAWTACVHALEQGQTHADLERLSQPMPLTEPGDLDDGLGDASSVAGSRSRSTAPMP